MSVCKCEDQGWSLLDCEIPYGERPPNNRPVSIEFGLGSLGCSLRVSAAASITGSSADAAGPCLTSHASFQIWHDFTRTGDEMNQGIRIEGTTSRRDRSGSSSSNNNSNIIIIINRANNDGFGLANLSMISQPCLR